VGEKTMNQKNLNVKSVGEQAGPNLTSSMGDPQNNPMDND